MDKKDVDLTPGVDWTSTPRKGREPIFGPGLWPAMAYLAGFATMVMIFRYLR